MKKTISSFLFIIVLIVAVSGLFLLNQKTEPQQTKDGLISYKNRLPPKYTETIIRENPRVYKIVYESKDANIYALLTLPKEGRNPVFIILPAASITKEIEQNYLGNDLNKLGFATFIIDQRGYGETDGYVPPIDEDIQLYLKGEEPFQYKMVYDALAAYDLLRTRDDIDPERIYIAGESMGGRYAIIAAAIEPGIKGVLAVSTSGYDIGGYKNEDFYPYLYSINPDNYISLISPRPIVMVHSKDDPVISFGMAEYTFSLAKEPKKFINVSGGHGSESIITDFVEDAVSFLTR